MIKVNAKIGVAAIVAALFVAFGAFGLGSTTTTSASPISPIAIGMGVGSPLACTPNSGTPGAVIPGTPQTVASGTIICIRANFANTSAPLSVTLSTTTGGTASSLNLLKATEYGSIPNTNTDVTNLAVDTDSTGPIYAQSQAILNQYPVLPAPISSLGYDLTTTLTCTADSTLTITSFQDSGPPLTPGVGRTITTTVNCQSTATGILSIRKIDQLGVIRGATFAVQQEAPTGSGNWINVATLVTSSTTTTQNPCASNTSCATNGTQYCTNGFATNCAQVPGSLPPNVLGGVTLPQTVPLRVVELSQPTSCTLVSVTDGSNSVLALYPYVTFASGLGSATSAARALTFVNSCQTPLAPVTANSAIAVVIGGATQGLTDSTHLEIVPAPGSDDDARVDIRVRDTNSTNVVGAHVTMSIDKGAMAMRTDTTGGASNCTTSGQVVTGFDVNGNPIYGNQNPFGGTVLPTNCYTGSGYEVIEPSPGATYFGSSYAGDTCDQDLVQQYNQATYTFNPTTGTYTPVSGYNGGITAPFLSNGAGQLRQIQDGYTNTDGIISACVYVNSDLAPGVTPGKMNITVIVEAPQSGFYPYGPANIILTASIPVVGPAASIKVAASPTSVQCGEKSTITATVTDSVGQNVSDHTRVELVSNAGATIGGTGSTLGFPGLGTSNPASSSAAETFSGVATAFLLTSTEHVGPYEVVVASGGSVGGVSTTIQPGVVNQTGAFSTAPVSAQVTVTCALPVTAAPAAPAAAAPIAAPRTGEGIRPPNTGDAGLASSNGSSTMFIVGGLMFALAGVATLKFARR